MQFKKVATATPPKKILTTTPKQMLTTTPKKMLTTTTEKMLTTTPEKKAGTTPEKMSKTTPKKILTTTPQKMLTSKKNNNKIGSKEIKIPEIRTGLDIRSEGTNKTKKGLSKVASAAFKILGKGKFLYKLIPGSVKGMVGSFLSHYIDEGFDKANERIDEKESAMISESIELVNQVLIPLIEVMNSVKEGSVFDCQYTFIIFYFHTFRLPKYYVFLFTDEEHRNNLAELNIKQAEEGYRERFIFYPPGPNDQRMLYGTLLQAFSPYKEPKIVYSKNLIFPENNLNDWLKSYYG